MYVRARPMFLYGNCKLWKKDTFKHFFDLKTSHEFNKDPIDGLTCEYKTIDIAKEYGRIIYLRVVLPDNNLPEENIPDD